jgi:hypothetical protein
LDMISFVLFSISFWVGNGVAAFRSINHLKRKWVYDVGFNFFSKICIIVSVYVCVCYCRVIYREWCRVRFLFQRSILCCRLYWVLGCRQWWETHMSLSNLISHLSLSLSLSLSEHLHPLQDYCDPEKKCKAFRASEESKKYAVKSYSCLHKSSNFSLLLVCCCRDFVMRWGQRKEPS